MPKKSTENAATATTAKKPKTKRPLNEIVVSDAEKLLKSVKQSWLKATSSESAIIQRFIQEVEKIATDLRAHYQSQDLGSDNDVKENGNDYADQESAPETLS